MQQLLGLAAIDICTHQGNHKIINMKSKYCINTFKDSKMKVYIHPSSGEASFENLDTV